MNRLRAYREIEDINQEELGELLGLAPSTVGAIEVGRREMTCDMSPTGYSSDRFELPEMSEPLHRHRAATKASAKKRAKELVRLAGEVFGELRRATPRAPATAVERLAPPTDFGVVEDYAVEARYMLRHEEKGPISNLTSAVERAGVCIVPIVGLEGIDGISSWVGDVPVIGLNPHVPGDRYRHSLGHELGHLSFHTKKSELSEAEASRFAGALLFPRDEFDEAMPEDPMLRDFVGLKRSWGVSVAGLVYRAHELGHIDDRRYRAIQIQMSKWRKNEPAQMAPVHGTLFGRLVEVNGGVSTVARDLGVNTDHVGELLNWSHLRLA